MGSRFARVKPKTYKMIFAATLLGIRIMCQSGATCVSTVCCFSDLALLKNQTKRFGFSTMQTSLPFHVYVQ